MKIPIGLIVLGLAVSGCGGENKEAGSTSVNQEAISQAASSDDLQAEVISALGAKEDQYGSLQFQADGASDPCGVSVVLTTPEEIALYEGAGDTIIKNPDGTAGIKLFVVSGDEEPCTLAADRALREVG